MDKHYSALKQIASDIGCDYEFAKNTVLSAFTEWSDYLRENGKIYLADSLKPKLEKMVFEQSAKPYIKADKSGFNEIIPSDRLKPLSSEESLALYYKWGWGSYIINIIRQCEY